MKVTVIPLVIGAFGTIPRWLVRELEDLEIRGQVETIQTPALSRSAKYWEESWKLEETCCHENAREKPPVNAGMKNSKRSNKWYMHNPAPVLENDTHKLLWDFNIQTDHIIPARRPDVIIINNNKKKKKKKKKREFAKLSTLLSRRTTE